MQSHLTAAREAARYLRRNPGFTLSAALGLALAITAATSMFAIANAVFLTPSGLTRFEELAGVTAERVSPTGSREPDLLTVSDLELLPPAYRSQTTLYAARSAQVEIQGTRHTVSEATVTANFFDVLASPAARGRTFAPGDRAGGCAVVANERLAQLFPSGAAVGESIRLNGTLCTVAGVVDAGRAFPEDTDLWSIAEPAAAASAAYVGLVRLRSPADTAMFAPYKVRLLSDAAGQKVQRSSFFGVALGVAITVVVALLNVGAFYLSRSSARVREYAVRTALGASARQIAQQMFAEVAGLLVIGVIVALLLVGWTTDLAMASFPDLTLPDDLLDVRTFTFTGAIALLMTVVVAASPLVAIMRRSSADMLREAGSGLTAGIHASRRRRCSIAFQLGSIAMLLSLGLTCITYVRRMASFDVGLDASRVNIVAADLEDSPQSVADVAIEPLLATVRSQTGMQPVSAWVGRSAPFNEPAGWAQPLPRGTEMGAGSRLMRYYEVTPGFFEVIGARLVSGRVINDSDMSTSTPVVVITRPMAERWWPGQTPLGRQLTFGTRPDLRPFTVIGVIENMQTPDELGRAFGSSALRTDYPIAFMPWAQRTLPTQYVRECLGCATVHIGYRGDARLGATAVRAALAPYLPGATLRAGSLLELQMGNRALRDSVLTARVLAAFAAISLLLAMIGVWALSEETIRRQWKELGIRAALGASPARLLISATAANLGYGVAGAALGAVLAFFMAPVLGRFTGLPSNTGHASATQVVAIATALISLHAIATLTAARRSPFISPRVALQDRTD